MNYIIDYINKYGSLDFNQKQFNEIDNVIFSQLAYTDFSGIVDNRILSLTETARRFYEIYTNDEIEALIGISEKSARLLMECAKTQRYGSVMLSDYVNYVDCHIDKQFSAICFHLNENDILIAFRGTDVTVTGTKESAMLSYMFPVPAQIEALHYFQETAMLSNGDIRICGHSKGGNLAVFAGVNCSNSLKKRIVGIYENDAPGFPKWFFDRFDYLQIKDRIFSFTPEGSLIGRMLEHDTIPVIVKSDSNGLKQHQVSSWIIRDDSFVKADEYDGMSNFVSEYINSLITYIGEDDLEVFFDTIEYVLSEMGIDDFYDLKKFEIRKAYALIDSFSAIDEKQNKHFKQVLKRVSTDFAREFLSSKAKGYSSMARDYTQKARNYLENLKTSSVYEETE